MESYIKNCFFKNIFSPLNKPGVPVIFVEPILVKYCKGENDKTFYLRLQKFDYFFSFFITFLGGAGSEAASKKAGSDRRSNTGRTTV